MNSYRPYLIRALYEWICDNGLTPHLLVDATAEGVSVPPAAVQDGQVVLNVAPRAVVGFNIDQDWVSFSARFSGVSHEIWVPIAAVLAIYARENGQGMVIPDDPYRDESDLEDAADNVLDGFDPGESQQQVPPPLGRPVLAAVSTEPRAESPETGDDPDGDDTPPPSGDDNAGNGASKGKGKGFLRVVK